MATASIIETWPDASQQAAQLVLDQYGDPHEATESRLTWYGVGPWKRVVAQRTPFDHQFPVPHTDSVENVIDYRVPPDKVSDIFRFDGSVIVERTAGEVSARCHDEQANNLALNLMHDIVTGARTVDDARGYYAQEFLNHRRNEPTPYMDGLQFRPGDGQTGDPDERALSDQDLERASEEGKRKQGG